MFMGADLSLCVQGRQDRKTVSRKEREGWSYGELVQRCNWYLSFSRNVSYFQRSSKWLRAQHAFKPHSQKVSHSFLMWFSLWRGHTLFTRVWNFLLVNCMTKGAQPTSVENKILSCVEKLFSPNLMAARYVCGLLFFILFTYLHLFPHPPPTPTRLISPFL